jgi:hypothetical protein
MRDDTKAPFDVPFGTGYEVRSDAGCVRIRNLSGDALATIPNDAIDGLIRALQAVRRQP